MWCVKHIYYWYYQCMTIIYINADDDNSSDDKLRHFPYFFGLEELFIKIKKNNLMLN